MVSLEVISGRTAGAKWSARRFPVLIGRAAEADVRIEEPGVWDRHVSISLEPREGFWLEAQSSAMVVLNDQPVERELLRNGDRIEIGSVKLRFWLAEARQRGLALREAFVWAILLGVTLCQVALIYWLTL